VIFEIRNFNFQNPNHNPLPNSYIERDRSVYMSLEAGCNLKLRF
jgi:hypothetical protein